MLLPLMVTVLTVSNSFAGIAIPDTRRDQTWINENVAASSFKERNNASIVYDSFSEEDSDDDETTTSTLQASVITKVDALTIEASASTADSKTEYGNGSDDDEETNKNLNIGGAYKIGENLSLGVQATIYTQEDSDDYNEVAVGAVYKLAGEQYLGLKIEQTANTNDDEIDYNTYSFAYGKRTDAVDYEAFFKYIAEDDNDTDYVEQMTQIGLLSVARFDALEIAGSLVYLTESYDGDLDDTETSLSYIFLRPEYMLNKELYIGAQIFYVMSETKDNDSDSKSDGTISRYGLFGRYILHDQIQLYASFDFGGADYDGSGSYTSYDSDVQIFNLKASYLW